MSREKEVRQGKEERKTILIISIINAMKNFVLCAYH